MSSYIERKYLATNNHFAKTQYLNKVNKKLSASPRDYNNSQQPFTLLNNFAWKYKPQPFKHPLKLKKKQTSKQNHSQRNVNSSLSLRNILPQGSMKSNKGINMFTTDSQNQRRNEENPMAEGRLWCFKKTGLGNHSKTCRQLQIKGLSFDQDNESKLMKMQGNVCCVKILQSKGNSYNYYRVKINQNESLITSLKKQICQKDPSIYFESVPKNPILDYYLSLPNSYENYKEMKLTLKIKNACPQPQVNLNSFEIISCIGSGGFSKVYLVRFKEDGQFYAMKVIDKQFIVKHKKKRIVMHERNVMKQLNHPFIMQMKFSFESNNKIVFILEFCPAGQLFGLVKKFRIMDESIAKFYAIQILLGLEQIHQNSIIYRDFKPENILIDLQGHVRIADFGLAKPDIKCNKTKAFSFCGSPQYMPPEMIMKKGHSFPVDFYCLGALLYELVTGLPPFYSKSAEQIYDGTLNKPITFPKHCKISNEMKNLLTQLLCKQESQRLGSLAGIKQVLCHPWFGKIDKKRYLQKNVKPPIGFNSYQDLKEISKQIEQGNEQDSGSIREIKQEQRLERDRKFQKIMDNFKYDYRKKLQSTLISQHRSRKESRKSKGPSSGKRKQSKESVHKQQIKLKLGTSRSHTSLGTLRKKKPELSARCLDLQKYL